MKNKRDTKYIYICPYCGNIAPFVVRDNTRPIRCHYCKNQYNKNERIKVKA